MSACVGTLRDDSVDHRLSWGGGLGGELGQFLPSRNS